MGCVFETEEPRGPSLQRDWPVLMQAWCGPQFPHPYICGLFDQLQCAEL